jgi:hypothetical protein
MLSPVSVSNNYNSLFAPNYLPEGFSKLSSKELLYQKKIKPYSESGTLPEAITATKKLGFCYENEAKSDFYNSKAEYKCSTSICPLEDMLNLVYDAKGADNKIQCANARAIQEIFPKLKIEQIVSIVLVADKKNIYEKLTAAACNKPSRYLNVSMPKLKIRNLTDSSVDTMMANIEINLDRKIPTGIMFFSDIFITPKKAKTSRHVNTVVGKRINPKTCKAELILRNSWGTSCAGYLEANPAYLVCEKSARRILDVKESFKEILECTRLHKPISRNPDVTCDPNTGYVYVTRSVLKNSLYQTTALTE